MVKKPRTREQYTLDSLLSFFKGGHFTVDETIYEPTPYQDPTSTRYITIIGGTKYDEQALYDHLEPFQHYVVGGGRGVEGDISKTYFDGEVTVLEPDTELYGKNARKVNVEQVLSFAPTSPLLLVGSGERVKQAKAWLKRAKWGREVVELP